MKKSITLNTLLKSILTLTLSASLIACNSGGSSTDQKANTTQGGSIEKPIIPDSSIVDVVENITSTEISGENLITNLPQYSYQQIPLSQNIQNGANAAIYHSGNLISPLKGGFGSSLTYSAPYFHPYNLASSVFNSPLIVKYQKNNKEAYLVVQSAIHELDVMQLDEAITNPNNANAKNTIIKYHSLYNGGVLPTDAAGVTDYGTFTLISLDTDSHNLTQNIKMHSHGSTWSPADNNALLNTAMFDKNEHIIVSKMIDNNGQEIYSVNVILNETHITQLRQTLLDNNSNGLMTLNSLYNGLKASNSTELFLTGLEKYNDLLKSEFGVRIDN